jgi:hypothetical protein
MPVAIVDGLKIGCAGDEKGENTNDIDDMKDTLSWKLTFKLRQLYKDYVRKALGI